MNPGKLNRRITIQEATTFTRDSFGADIPVWEDIDEIWSSIRTISGNEQLDSGQIYASDGVIFGMRYRALNPSARISYSGKIYNIRSIQNVDDENRELRVIASVEST